jgi:hypothetical protein
VPPQLAEVSCERRHQCCEFSLFVSCLRIHHTAVALEAGATEEDGEAVALEAAGTAQAEPIRTVAAPAAGNSR